MLSGKRSNLPPVVRPPATKRTDVERKGDFDFQANSLIRSCLMSHTVPQSLLITWSKIYRASDSKIKAMIISYYRQVVENFLLTDNGKGRLIRKGWFGGYYWNNGGIEPRLGVTGSPTSRWSRPDDFLDDFFNAYLGGNRKKDFQVGAAIPELEQLVNQQVQKVKQLRNDASSIPLVGSIPGTRTVQESSNTEYINYPEEVNLAAADKLSPVLFNGSPILSIDRNTLATADQARYDTAMDAVNTANESRYTEAENRLDVLVKNTEGRFAKFRKRWGLTGPEVMKKVFRGALTAGVGALAATAFVASGGTAGVLGVAGSALVARRVAAAASSAGIATWDARRSGKTGKEKAKVAGKTFVTSLVLGSLIGEYVAPAVGHVASTSIDKFAGAGTTDLLIEKTKSTAFAAVEKVSDFGTGTVIPKGKALLDSAVTLYNGGTPLEQLEFAEKHYASVLDSENISLEKLKVIKHLTPALESQIETDKVQLASVKDEYLLAKAKVLQEGHTVADITNAKEAELKLKAAENTLAESQKRLSKHFEEIISQDKRLESLQEMKSKSLAAKQSALIKFRGDTTTDELAAAGKKAAARAGTVSVPVKGFGDEDLSPRDPKNIITKMLSTVSETSAPTPDTPAATPEVGGGETGEVSPATVDSPEILDLKGKLALAQERLSVAQNNFNKIIAEASAEKNKLTSELSTQIEAWSERNSELLKEINVLRAELASKNSLIPEPLSGEKVIGNDALVENGGESVVVDKDEGEGNEEGKMAFTDTTPLIKSISAAEFGDTKFNPGDVQINGNQITLSKVPNSQAVLNAVIKHPDVITQITNGTHTNIPAGTNLDNLLEKIEAKMLALAEEDGNYRKKAAGFFGIKDFTEENLRRIPKSKMNFDINKFIEIYPGTNRA